MYKTESVKHNLYSIQQNIIGRTGKKLKCIPIMYNV